MGDGGGLTWVGHRLDLVEALLVADADAFVLAEVFFPGADDALLEDAAGFGRVVPHAPADRACAPSGVAPGVERIDEVSLAPGLGQYSTVTCTGPWVAAASARCGAGQSPAGSRSLGEIALNGSHMPVMATSASPMAAASSASVSPAFCAIAPNAALPTAPPRASCRRT